MSTDPIGAARARRLLGILKPMSPRLSETTLRVAARQADLIASWQVTSPELRALRRAVRTKAISTVSHHVFALSRQELTPKAHVWAAALHCGKHARVGGYNALVLHGWSSDLRTPVDVVVPPTVRPHDPPDFVRVRRLGLPGVSHLGPPRVSVHDAAIQAAAWAKSDREAIYVLVSAMQQRLTTPGRLLQLVTANTRRRALITSMVAEYRDGIQSMAEYDFARLCPAYGLPSPSRQEPVTDASGKVRSIDVEFRVNGRSLRVEIEGMHHLNPDNWLDDIDRHNDVVLAGHDAYLRVATFTLRTNPRPFFLRLRAQILQLAEAA